MTLPRFDLDGQVAVVTGGSGVLGQVMARGLAAAGASVAVLARRLDPCAQVSARIEAGGGRSLPVAADVLDRSALERALAEIEAGLGPPAVLVNAAGGNQPAATTAAERPFFTLDADAAAQVFAANFTGAFLACQVFGRRMAEAGAGAIVNVTSMAAVRPLTRVPAYSAAKAAVANFTQWLAVHLAQEYSPRLRVNALAPGFFLTAQNRYLLVDSVTGGWTERGAQILAHTPLGRLGDPQDLLGALLWLVSPASEFVTGVVVPVDGGFSAFGGV
jgi:NAD(P)-dependent dehydrogenase (short-subunit alcohol dehydrogenase family)